MKTAHFLPYECNPFSILPSLSNTIDLLQSNDFSHKISILGASSAAQPVPDGESRPSEEVTSQVGPGTTQRNKGIGTLKPTL